MHTLQQRFRNRMAGPVTAWLILVILIAIVVVGFLFDQRVTLPAAAQFQPSAAKAMLQSARGALEQAIAEEKIDPSEESKFAVERALEFYNSVIVQRAKEIG